MAKEIELSKRASFTIKEVKDILAREAGFKNGSSISIETLFESDNYTEQLTGINIICKSTSKL